MYAVPDAASRLLEGKSRDFAEYEAAGSGVSGKAAAMNENIIQGDSSEARVDTRIMESGDRMGVGGSSLQLQHLVPGASI
jgi:capsid protein